MKKTLFTLVAATAMIIGLAGCDKVTKNAWDSNSENWPSQKSDPTKTADADKGTVVLKNTKDIQVNGNWCVWTDENGLVIDSPTPTTDADGNLVFKFTGDQINQVDLNKEGNEPRPHSERFVLYINLKGTNTTVKNPKTGAKDGNLEDFDARGRICVYDDSQVVVAVEKYKELVNKVGVVSIKNDEPTETGSVYKNGDYTITEIWPLDPLADKDDKTEEDGSVTYVNAKIGGQYAVSEAMVFKKLSIKKGDTVKFPVKAGSQIVGLYQPNREKATDGNELEYNGPSAEDIVTKKLYDLDGDKKNEATRVELYGLDVSKLDYKKAEDAEKIKAAYAKANTATIFGNLIEVKAHKEATTVDSSSFNTYYFKAKDKVRFKAAVNDYVADVTVVEAPIEK